MEKTIKIDNKEYKLKSSAYTMFAYKDFTGRDLLQDVNDLKEKYNSISKLSNEEQQSAWMKEFTNILNMALKMCYVMIKENDNSFIAYEDWLKELNNLFDDQTWIIEVMTTALAPFQRQL